MGQWRNAYKTFCLKELNCRRYLLDLRIDGRIILKLTFRGRYGRLELWLIWAKRRRVVGFCERGNERFMLSVSGETFSFSKRTPLHVSLPLQSSQDSHNKQRLSVNRYNRLVYVTQRLGVFREVWAKVSDTLSVYESLYKQFHCRKMKGRFHQGYELITISMIRVSVTTTIDTINIIIVVMIINIIIIILPEEKPTRFCHFESNRHQRINPLNTKRRLLYLKTQSVPRSKHFSSRL